MPQLQLNQTEWRKRYGALRQLIKNPDRKTAGQFSRVYYGGAEYIYNSTSRRVIAKIMPEELTLQRRSMYNSVLTSLIPIEKVVHNTERLQIDAVGKVGRRLLNLTGEKPAYAPVRYQLNKRGATTRGAVEGCNCPGCRPEPIQSGAAAFPDGPYQVFWTNTVGASANNLTDADIERVFYQLQ